MKNILFACLLLLPVCLINGQATTGYYRQSQVLARASSGVTAQVVPYASVVVSNTATGAAATIYSDPLLSDPIDCSCVTADESGNYGYYIALGTIVTETISSPGQGTRTIPNVGSVNGGLSNPVQVPQGGSGLTSLSPYDPLAGGTTPTGPMQQIPVGTAGQVLTSNGAGALPTMQNPSQTLAVQVNGTPTSSQTVLNAITSTTNSAGLTDSPSNPSGGSVKHEITGTVNTTSGGTGTDSHTATGVAQVSSGTWSASTALANGTTATTQSPGDNTTKVATDAFATAIASNGCLGGNTIANGCTSATTAAGAAAAIVNGQSIAPSSVAATGTVASFPINPVTQIAYGDSNTALPSSYVVNQANAYVNRLASAFGVGYPTDRALVGAKACDVGNLEMFPNDTPSLTMPQPYKSIMIGTNDVNGGTGAYETVFNGCLEADLVWGLLPSPSAFRVNGSTFATTGTCAVDNTYTASPGVTCTASGATATATITVTSPGVLYILARLFNSDTGTWTYQVDSGSVVSVSSQLPVSIASTIGSTYAPFLFRVSGLTAGSHTVHFAQTGNGNMALLGLGTVPTGVQPVGLPYLVVGPLPNQQDGANQSIVNVYRADTMADFNQLAADGLNLFLAPVPTFAQATTVAGDMASPGGGLHFSDSGHGELAQAFLYPFTNHAPGSMGLYPVGDIQLQYALRNTYPTYSMIPTDSYIGLYGGNTLAMSTATNLQGKIVSVFNGDTALNSYLSGVSNMPGSNFAIRAQHHATFINYGANYWGMIGSDDPLNMSASNQFTANVTNGALSTYPNAFCVNGLASLALPNAPIGVVKFICNASASTTLAITGISGGNAPTSLPPYSGAIIVSVATTGSWNVIAGYGLYDPSQITQMSVASGAVILGNLTNLVPNSSLLTAASWTQLATGYQFTVTGGQTDHNGGTTAVQLVTGATTGHYASYIASTEATPPNPSTACVSAWLKGAAGGETGFIFSYGNTNQTIPALTTSWKLYAYTITTTGAASHGFIFSQTNFPASPFTVTMDSPQVFIPLNGVCPAQFAYTPTTASAVTNNPGVSIGGYLGAKVIASGTATMTTAAITAPACGSTVTVSAPGALTTDTIKWSFNASPDGTDSGLLSWATANNVNFAYCGFTETPTAATINWSVSR